MVKKKSRTPRKKSAVRKFADKLELFSDFIKDLPDAIGMVDLNGRYIALSQKNVEMLGYGSAEELIGKSMFEIFPAQELERARKRFPEMIREGGDRHVEYLLKRKDGSLFLGEISSSVLKDETGKPAAVVGITRDITERRRMEDALKDAAEFRQAVFKASPDAVTLMDLNGTIIDFSEKVLKMHGYERPEELLGKPVSSLTKPTWAGDFHANFRRMIEQGGMPPREYVMLRKDGTSFIGEVSTSVVRDAHGRPKSVVGISRDITERKKSEEALRESIELYQKLLKTSPDSVIVLDLSGKIIEVSEQAVIAEKVNGPEDLLGRSVFEFLPPEEHEHATANLQKTLATGFSGTLEYKMRRLDGSPFIGELRSALVKDGQGRPKAFIATVRDITERKLAEQALRESEEKFRTLVNSMDDIVVTMDLGLRYTGIYGRWLEKLGDKFGDVRERIKGVNLEQLLKLAGASSDIPIAASLEAHERALKGEHVVYMNSLSFNDTRYYFQISLSPIKNQKGEITGLVGVCRDITALKKIEENLARAEKLESLGILAGGIAHDFNNILTAIVGNISLARLQGPSDDKALSSLEEAEKAAMRAKDLTQQLLTFARGGEPVKKPVSLGDLIRESCEFILCGSKSRCEFVIPDKLWLIEADESQLRQVFHNLAINADQAMPRGGLISVSCENVALRENNEWQLKPGRYVKIVFSDQGVGIPEEHQSRIFDPFFTTKQKGSGLGLTIIHSIITKHEGRISVSSKPGEGASFEIYLPASEQPLPSLSEPPVMTGQGKGRILVMDDDEGIRRVASGLLEHLGCQVSLAGDGAEAVKLYQEAKNSGRPFDLVIMDLTVNSGMGGKEAMQKLRSIDPLVKAVVSSGYSTDPVMSDYEKWGFIGVIAKPYGLKRMKEILQTYLPS